MKDNYPEVVKEIMKSLYVDDISGGMDTVRKGYNLKEFAVSVVLAT